MHKQLHNKNSLWLKQLSFKKKNYCTCTCVHHSFYIYCVECHSHASSLLHYFILIIPFQEALQVIDTRALPPVVDIEDMNKKKIEKQYRPPTAELISYLDFNISTTGVLSGVKVCPPIECIRFHCFIFSFRFLMLLYI